MKIFIDIGHPAHVHYFKNFIKIMKKEGHVFFITSREKECTLELLQSYDLPFFSRGKGKNGMFGKLLYMIKADYILYKKAKKFKPDLFLSFASPYAAQASWLMNKPHITFDDTEHAHLAHKLYAPFTDVILSPSCFYEPFSKKQVFFNSYMELCYLHQNYFKPNSSILKELGLKKNEKYIIIRFISWNANHDIGEKGISYSTKKELIFRLSEYAKVFISSEDKLPDEFESYRLNINPEKLHDALAFASLYIGEGSTTASECAVLGTPNIYVNSLVVGYCKEQAEKYKICFHFKTDEGIINKAVEMLNDDKARLEYKENHLKMLLEKIDPTVFMVWFVKNYPESASIMKKNPDYQNKF